MVMGATWSFFKWLNAFFFLSQHKRDQKAMAAANIIYLGSRILQAL